MSTPRFTHVSPPPLRVLAAMGAVLVLLLALVVTAGRAGAAPVAVSSGSVEWGVKASFRTYITSPVAAGSVTPSGGVTANSNGTFNFGVSSGTLDSATSAIDLTTAGGVRFLGHEGALDVQISDLRVDVDGTTGTLIVDATSLSFPGGVLGTYDDVAIATLNLAGIIPSGGAGTHSWTNVPAKLTAAGVPVFAGFYPADSALDPVTFTATLESPSTTSTSTTSSTVPESTTTTSSTVPEESTTTTSSTVPTTTPGESTAVTGGYLDWGVKESFRKYIVSPVAHGTIETGGSATKNVDGTFRFPATGGTASTDGEGFDADFGGSVRFTGHEGQLDMLLTGLEVRAEGDEGVLVADVTSRKVGTPDATPYPDVELAELDLKSVTPGSNGLTVTWSSIAAKLTAAGVPAFGDFYTAGTALDPLTVVLDVEKTTVAPGTGGGGVVTESASLDKILLAPGDALTVEGSGFIPGEQVEVWLHSTPLWVATTVASASGDVSFTFDLPDDLAAGAHHVELVGITSGRTLASPTFTVAGSGTAARAVNGRGALPFTGGDSLPVGAAGLVLVLAGAGLAVVARRRSRPA